MRREILREAVLSAIASREIARDKICTFSLPLASGGKKLLPLQGSLPLRLVELLALLGGVLVGLFQLVLFLLQLCLEKALACLKLAPRR